MRITIDDKLNLGELSTKENRLFIVTISHGNKTAYGSCEGLYNALAFASEAESKLAKAQEGNFDPMHEMHT